MPDINYEETIKRAIELIKEQTNIEREYFDLLRKINALSHYSDLVNPHLFELKMADQVLVFKATVQLLEVDKYLCDKYKLSDNAETEETQDVN